MASNVNLACSAEVERFLAEETVAFTQELAEIAAEGTTTKPPSAKRTWSG